MKNSMPGTRQKSPLKGGLGNGRRLRKKWRSGVGWDVAGRRQGAWDSTVTL